MKERIQITEVGPRDGLQNESQVIKTDDKLEYIRLLKESGLKKIEATSFVRADRIPQLSDALELSKKINFSESVGYSALTPNLKGYENAIQAGFKEIAIFGAASESFTKKNINRTVEESIRDFSVVTEKARQDGIKVRGYISTVIACPYEGKISPEKVQFVVKEMQDMGVYEISLGETIGVGVPKEVESLLDVLLKYNPPEFFAGHFHDTYGMAIANVSKSIEMGLRSFDASSGGLGGCPYAKGASGNLATEDLVYFLEKSGYETGVDLNSLVRASQFIESKLNRSLISKTYLTKIKTMN